MEVADRAVARYGHPADALRTLAVTGTNGKTTTVHILRALLDRPDAPAASVGTLGVLLRAAGEMVPGGLGLTTPGADELQRVLRDLVDRGVTTVAMEVSSHALDQYRVRGITYDVALFTNFTRDHLDYHETMEDYFAAKAKLVGYLRPSGVAVVNADEPAWGGLPPAPRALTFGLSEGDVRARDIRYDGSGSRWRLEHAGRSAEVRLPLLGDFNVANALGAAGALLALGESVESVAKGLARAPQVPGRLERIADAPVVLRDYAHTPDALERSLTALRPFVRGRLILVFGAGGDRDPGKRPLMGEVAGRLADVVIVSSDNPRTEDPARIVDDIERGMHTAHERIVDRRDAIARALALAAGDDVVLLAGKGHETYQVVGTEKQPFDEREVVRQLTGGMR